MLRVEIKVLSQGPSESATFFCLATKRMFFFIFLLLTNPHFSYPGRKSAIISPEAAESEASSPEWAVKTSLSTSVKSLKNDAENHEQNTERRRGASAGPWAPLHLAVTLCRANGPGPSSLKIIARARTSDGTPVFDFVVKR